MESNKTVIVDIRYPMLPFSTLTGHTNCVNSIAWGPNSGYFQNIYTFDRAYLCTAGDDSHTLIWDLAGQGAGRGNASQQEHLEPMLAYKAEAEVSMLQWPISNPEWICISFNDKMQMLKV